MKALLKKSQCFALPDNTYSNSNRKVGDFMAIFVFVLLRPA